MWLPNNKHDKKEGGGNALIAVAIDKDKNSQTSLKWAIDNLAQKGQTILLLHVKIKSSVFSNSPSNNPRSNPNWDQHMVCKGPDPQTRELFLPFRVFCTRKNIQCKDIVLEDLDVAKALIEYSTQNAVEHLVVGASAKSCFLRFKQSDIPGTVMKLAPDFTNVYIISKGKPHSSRAATRPAPAVSPLRNQMRNQTNTTKSEPGVYPPNNMKDKPQEKYYSHEVSDSFRSPFTRKGPNGKSYPELPMPDFDISYVSSGRPSIDRIFPTYYYAFDSGKATPPRMSNGTEIDMNHSFESMNYFGRKSVDITSSPQKFSSISHESDRSSSASQTMDDVEAGMRRLKLELKQTMDMYSTACKEALTAKQKAVELQRWKLEEERRLEDAKLAEEAPPLRTFTPAPPPSAPAACQSCSLPCHTHQDCPLVRLSCCLLRTLLHLPSAPAPAFPARCPCSLPHQPALRACSSCSLPHACAAALACTPCAPPCHACKAACCCLHAHVCVCCLPPCRLHHLQLLPSTCAHVPALSCPS